MGKIIDIHNHPNWHGHNIDKLVKNMDEYGIDKCWLLSWEIAKRDFELNPWWSRYMDPRDICVPLWMVVEGMQKYPDRFIGGYAPDPKDKYARSKLISAMEIHGIKVYGELKLRIRYDDPDAIAMFRFCGEIGLPVLIHMEFTGAVPRKYDEEISGWPDWYGGPIEVVDNICTLCPDTTFIGHAMGFWREISADADAHNGNHPGGAVVGEGNVQKLLRKHPNLYGDLSGCSGCNALIRDIKHAGKFVDEFQDRLLYGRDDHNNDLQEALRMLDLSQEVLNKILYINAENLIA